MLAEHACCKCGKESPTLLCDQCKDDEQPGTDDDRQRWHQAEQDAWYSDMMREMEVREDG